MRRLIFFGVAIFLSAIAVYSFMVLRGSYVELVIDYKNVSKVSIYELGDQQHGDGKKDKPETDSGIVLKTSGEATRLKKGLSYIVYYNGAPGYENNELVIPNLNSDKRLVIYPYLSRDELSRRLVSETPAIHQALKQKFPNIGLYTISPGQLYWMGEWYGTTLIYQGPFSPNRDTLRVVLEKKDGVWLVRTDPAYISLSRFSYPEVPFKILDGVNRLVVPEVTKPKPGGAVIRS